MSLEQHERGIHVVSVDGQVDDGALIQVSQHLVAVAVA